MWIISHGVRITHWKFSLGVWVVEEAEKMPLTGDRGLVLKSKAKHAAISVPLRKPFTFVDKPLVVQYEVNLQNGQECGGAYIKVRPSLYPNASSYVQNVPKYNTHVVSCDRY